MKHLILVTLAALVIGCGIDTSDTNGSGNDKSLESKYPWNGHIDATSSRGIHVSYTLDPHPHYTMPDVNILLETIDRKWTEAQECTNIFIDPDRPFIIEYVKIPPSGLNGFIYWKKAYTYAQVGARDKAGWHTTKHEMLHYLHYLNGGDGDPDHSSRIWEDC